MPPWSKSFSAFITLKMVVWEGSEVGFNSPYHRNINNIIVHELWRITSCFIIICFPSFFFPYKLLIYSLRILFKKIFSRGCEEKWLKCQSLCLPYGANGFIKVGEWSIFAFQMGQLSCCPPASGSASACPPFYKKKNSPNFLMYGFLISLQDSQH